MADLSSAWALASSAQSSTSWTSLTRNGDREQTSSLRFGTRFAIRKSSHSTGHTIPSSRLVFSHDQFKKAVHRSGSEDTANQPSGGRQSTQLVGRRQAGYHSMRFWRPGNASSRHGTITTARESPKSRWACRYTRARMGRSSVIHPRSARTYVGSRMAASPA